MFFPDLERILQCSKIQIIVLDHMLPCKIGSIIHFQHGNDFMEGGGGWGWGAVILYMCYQCTITFALIKAVGIYIHQYLMKNPINS